LIGATLSLPEDEPIQNLPENEGVEEIHRTIPTD